MKLSIIIPIYKVETYLRKSIDSVLAQDMSSSEYEVILVDDESPDKCPQICDEYERAYGNIRVVHRENGGLSAARNSGIEVAKGEYIMFVDSDDYIEPNVLGGLMEHVQRDNLDVLRYRLQYVRIVNSEELIVNSGESRVKSLEPIYEVYNPYKSDPFKGNDYTEIPIDGVTFLNTRMSTACYAWAFVVKRSLLVKNEGVKELKSECLFTPGIYFEDTDWTPRMLCRAKRVASTNTIVYNYLQREGSITNAVNRSKQKKVLDDKIRLIGELKRQSNELEQKGLSNAWFSRMIADNVISIIGIISRDFYDQRCEYLLQLKKQNIYPINSKSIKARLINLFPSIVVELLNFKYQ